MELKYVWVKDYKMFKDFGVNLSHSGTDCFSYDNETFEVLPKEKPVLTFGENISSVTAIAGQNGSGKSTLFELLIYAIATYENGALGYSKPIYGIVCIDKFIFYHQDLIGIDKESIERKGYEVFSYEESPLESANKILKFHQNQVGFVYYSNVIDWRSTYDEINLKNYSSEQIIWDDINYGPNLTNRYTEHLYQKNNDDIATDMQAYHIEENYHFVRFALNFPQFYPFNEPREFRIELTYYGNNKHLTATDPNLLSNKIFTDFLNGTAHETEKISIDAKKFKEAQYQYYKLNIVKLLFDEVLENEESWEFIINDNFEVSFLNGREDVITLTKSFKVIISNSLQPEQSSIAYFKQRYRDTSDWRFYLMRNTWLQNSVDTSKALQLFIKLEEDVFKYSFNERKRINNYFLNDNLSSGEFSFYALFSRLHRLIWENQRDKENQKDSFVILIDEAEIGFHPEWKKNFLSWIVDFFNREFVDVDIQLILSTHSPYFLSDLHTDNVILLKKGNNGITNIENLSKKKIFAANIHELLSESFFLEDGLIGKYAKDKIDKLISYLSDPKENSDFNKTSAQQLIDIIGEPLIKDMLQAKYDEHFQSDAEIRDEIERLQAKLKS